MKKFLAALFLWFAPVAVLAQTVVSLPVAVNSVSDLGNGPQKLRVIAGNARLFTSQGNGTGSTSGSSTALTLTGTPATPPCVGCGISGPGIAAGTTVAAYNGTTGITLSAAMTVPGGSAITWGAACPGSYSGTQYLASGVNANYFIFYTAARVCAASPGGSPNSVITIPVFFEPGFGIPAGDVALGTAALGTSSISSGSCASAVTVATPGVLTTDIVDAGFNSDPTGITGYTAPNMLTIIPYPTIGNVNFKVCNNTPNPITPGAVTLNWAVRR